MFDHPVSPAARAVAVLAIAALSSSQPASAQLLKEEKAKVSLVTDRASHAPGGTARLAAVLEIEPGWHVNSNRPTFDYLIPTEASFEVSAGWPVGTPEFPPAKMLPFAFVDQPIAVYEGKVAIVAEVAIPAGTGAGNVPVSVSVRYQACNDSTCLAPVKSRAEGILVVGAAGAPQHAELFAAGAAEESLFASSHGAQAEPAEEPVVAAQESAPPPTAPPATEPAAPAPTDPEPTDPAPLASAPAPAPAKPARLAPSLLSVLLMALVGGLILNVMPCVLPVLSLKVFGLVKSAAQGRAEVVRGGLTTALGILASFWLLAVAAIVAKSAGAAVGWGVQFQEPGFVTFLAVVVVLFSLNLWGVFEIPLPARLANRLAGGAPREGIAGHFASGLFATLMATPCSAPFLGTAMGFGLAQPAWGIFAIFTAVGLGMALPFLLLAIWPGAANLLPKPGAWMDTLRGAMGFLLAGAAVWLFYVLAAQVGTLRLAMIQLALLVVALCLWLASHRVNLRRPLKRLASLVAIVAGIQAVVLAATAAPAAAKSSLATGLIQWVPFDRVEAERLASEGRTVFVDVTADWCLTCKVNERVVLETKPVAEAFERHQVIPMKADWTNYDPAIGDFLQSHGRSGIPFYVLYRPGQEPYVFSEVLTQERVVGALDAGT